MLPANAQPTMQRETDLPAAADTPKADAAAAPLSVVVAHGSPSDPDPLDLTLRALAGDIAVRMSDRRRIVRGATLAKTGSLEAALSAPPGQLIRIYPFFMSDGFFVRRELRRRVAEATCNPVEYSAPFGLDPLLPALCVKRACEAIERSGCAARDSVLVLAAHGSRSNPASAEATRLVERRIREMGVFAEVRSGFVEEAPSIADAASGLGSRPAVCLPLFATSGGHVEGDIPEELDRAGFTGKLLQPIGEDAEIPALIAATLGA